MSNCDFDDFSKSLIVGDGRGNLVGVIGGETVGLKERSSSDESMSQPGHVKVVMEEERFRQKLEKVVRERLAIEKTERSERKLGSARNAFEWILREVLEVSVI